MSINHKSLAQFIVEAKRRTYASQGDDASVQALLNDRNNLSTVAVIIFIEIFILVQLFIGQETVEFENRPIWSMVYSGGVTNPNSDWDIMGPIYNFLRQALRSVDTNSIYRGPNYYKSGTYIFKNEYEGTLDCFQGKEIILIGDEKVYELKYSGGIVR